PLLTPADIAWLESPEAKSVKIARVDMTFDVGGGAAAFDRALTEICRAGEEAIDNGATIIVLTDRAVSVKRAPMPSLLAVGALHHHLIGAAKRLGASIVAESGECRDTHLFAALL